MTDLEPFPTRLLRLIDERSPLCLGIDPAAGSLEAAGLPDSPEGIDSFAGTLLDAALDSVAAVKPQMGYFERFGPAGLEALARVCERTRAAGGPVIVDAKRSDIGSTKARFWPGLLGPRPPPPAPPG